MDIFVNSDNAYVAGDIMNNKKFIKALIAVLAAGIICTAALTAYTVYRHNHCSILTYIGNER